MRPPPDARGQAPLDERVQPARHLYRTFVVEPGGTLHIRVTRRRDNEILVHIHTLVTDSGPVNHTYLTFEG